MIETILRWLGLVDESSCEHPEWEACQYTISDTGPMIVPYREECVKCGKRRKYEK